MLHSLTELYSNVKVSVPSRETYFFCFFQKYILVMSTDSSRFCSTACVNVFDFVFVIMCVLHSVCVCVMCMSNGFILTFFSQENEPNCSTMFDNSIFVSEHA